MSELYELPNGWEWKKLGDLTKTTSGGTPKRNEKSYWGGNIGWLKSGELNDGYIKEVEEFITEDGLNKSSAKLFPKGTLLIAMYGATVGKLGILEIDTTTNQAVCGILNDKNTFETFFMFYFLRHIRKKMLIDSFGGAQPNLSQTYIKDLDIPLPPLSEQQRIVSKLDLLFEKIDKSIALHQKNMDEANVFMGSILNDVFGELEEKYGKTLITNVMKVSNKTLVPNNDEEYNYVGLENIESNSGKLVDFLPTMGSEIKSSKVLFKKGMVLYGKLRPYLNKVWISNFDGVATTEILPFYPIDKNGLDMNYVKHYFLSPSFLNKVMNNCSGARMPRLTTKFIKSNEAYIPIPSIFIQQKVVKYLDEVSQIIEKVKSVQKEKMNNLKALKASILDKAFRGEL